MTETEQLKRNAEVEFAKQRMDEVGKYMDALVVNIKESTYWAFRADKLFFFAFLMYFPLILVGEAIQTPEVVKDIAYEFHVIFVWVSIFRSWFLYREMSVAIAEWDGAMTMLEKLGMIRRDDGGESEIKRRAKPMFERIKTFIEKVFERESKEAFSPV